MRFIFKTTYDQDIDLAKHGGQRFWYSLLLVALAAAPWVVSEYWLSQLTFILIYGIVGLGLMLLSGFTGLFSIGHAAFLGVGAYTEGVLAAQGWPFPLSLACAVVLSAVVGVVVGLPALRVKGIYLGIATLAFGFIVEEVLARWESVTGGNAGLHVKGVDLFGLKVSGSESFYLLCLVLAVIGLIGVILCVQWQVIGRYVFNDTPTWAEALALVLVLFVTAFGVAVGVRDAGHIGLESMVSLLPEAWQRRIEVLIHVLVGSFGALMVYGGWIWMVAKWNEKKPMLPVTDGIDYLPVVIAGVLIVLFSIEHIIALARGTVVEPAWN